MGDISVADKQDTTVLTSRQSLGSAPDKHVSRLERQSAGLHGADNKFHDFQTNFMMAAHELHQQSSPSVSGT
jgi:hypothetical protein